LKDCEENKPFDRRSINGVLIRKNEWHVSEKKIDKLIPFENILDIEENDAEGMEKKKHEALIKAMADEKEKKALIEQDKKVEEAGKNLKFVKPIKVESETITNDAGDIIDLSMIKQIESKEASTDIADKFPERKKYNIRSWFKKLLKRWF